MLDFALHLIRLAVIVSAAALLGYLWIATRRWQQERGGAAPDQRPDWML